MLSLGLAWIAYRLCSGRGVGLLIQRSSRPTCTFQLLEHRSREASRDVLCLSTTARGGTRCGGSHCIHIIAARPMIPASARGYRYADPKRTTSCLPPTPQALSTMPCCKTSVRRLLHDTRDCVVVPGPVISSSLRLELEATCARMVVRIRRLASAMAGRRTVPA
ncbi:hypothetical protein V8D89_004826 [Ganoderma adspersum]